MDHRRRRWRRLAWASVALAATLLGITVVQQFWFYTGGYARSVTPWGGGKDTDSVDLLSVILMDNAIHLNSADVAIGPSGAFRPGLVQLHHRSTPPDGVADFFVLYRYAPPPGGGRLTLGLAYPLLLSLAIAALAFHRCRPPRLPPGTTPCPACGYDLRATPTRCPECGATPSTLPTA